MEKYLEGKEVTEAEIRTAIRSGTLSLKIVPVLCGSAFRNKGVQPMLDAVVDYSAVASRYSSGQGGRARTDEVGGATGASDDAPFSALAFKIMTDPFVGTLTFLSGLFGLADFGRERLQFDQEQARANRSFA